MNNTANEQPNLTGKEETHCVYQACSLFTMKMKKQNRDAKHQDQ
jgi:hypothetical protein